MAELAPEVQLPCGLRAHIHAPKLRGKQVVRVRGRVGAARLNVVGASLKLLRLGIELADGLAETGAGLDHAGAGFH
jgi:hypothetical protein